MYIMHGRKRTAFNVINLLYKKFFFLPEGATTSHEWIGGLVILVVYVVINILTFRLCGQDGIRSVIFGMSSMLIPAGQSTLF
jgi:hypothetical protein